MADQVNAETGEVVNASVSQVPKEIIKARIAVMKDAFGVGKTGRNQFHNYDYASDYDVLSLVQPSMAKNGLMLDMWPDEVVGPDENGNMWVRFLMQWQHESGACSEPKPWWGIAQDRDRQGRMGDKWFNKAATAAEKYFLLKQFHIPAGKDVDPDKSAHEGNPAYQGGGQPAPAKRYTGRVQNGQNGTQGRETAQTGEGRSPAGQSEGADSSGHAKQIAVIDADGQEVTFARTKKGALDAIAFIERELTNVEISDGAKLWEANADTFHKLAAAQGVGDLKPAEGAQSLADRVHAINQAFGEYLNSAA